MYKAVNVLYTSQSANVIGNRNHAVPYVFMMKASTVQAPMFEEYSGHSCGQSGQGKRKRSENHAQPWWVRVQSDNCPDHIIPKLHYSDVIMGAMASQITSLTIVYSTVYSGADQRKHQCSASLAFVGGIHRWPVNSPHKWPVTRKMFLFDDVIKLDQLVHGFRVIWKLSVNNFILTATLVL